eukprot:Colp12_sorted_trinity150504_noHs@18339
MSNPPKLWAVTRIHGAIRKPQRIKDTLKGLGLNHNFQTVVKKNVPYVNGMIRTAAECVAIKPVEVVSLPEPLFRKLYVGSSTSFLAPNGKLYTLAKSKSPKNNQ